MEPRPLLCTGSVMHRRLRPAPHAFVYPVFYVVLPLRHLSQASNAVFSVDRPNLMSFHSKDHGPRDGSPLLPWIEALLAEHGLPQGGAIWLQTFPRLLGFVFNPVSFWYCHDAQDQLIAVLAEVNNTFGGTHCYLLHDRGRPLPDGVTLHADKTLHVSPFNRVEGGYRFHFRHSNASQRGAQRVRIDYSDHLGDLLHTAISGQARPWSAKTLLTTLARMPLMTLGVYARIHWQAWKLWRKGVPFLGAHPTPHTVRD